MKEDRNTRDHNGGPATERETQTESAAYDVWARAAAQALRDLARANSHSASREKSGTKPVTP